MDFSKGDVISDVLQLSAANPHTCVETQMLVSSCKMFPDYP
jgi:hypothetical protein